MKLPGYGTLQTRRDKPGAQTSYWRKTLLSSAFKTSIFSTRPVAELEREEKSCRSWLESWGKSHCFSQAKRCTFSKEKRKKSWRQWCMTCKSHAVRCSRKLSFWGNAMYLPASRSHQKRRTTSLLLLAVPRETNLVVFKGSTLDSFCCFVVLTSKGITQPRRHSFLYRK